MEEADAVLGKVFEPRVRKTHSDSVHTRSVFHLVGLLAGKLHSAAKFSVSYC